MRNGRRRVATSLAAVAGVPTLLTGRAARAAAFPDRPIKMLLGYAPGGGIDILGRFLAQRVGAIVGQTIVVENRAGASGAVAAATLVNARPDGYTVFLMESATLVAPSMQPVSYDPVKNFQPVALVGALNYGIAVHPDVPAKTLKELFALIRQSPGKFNYGSPGAGNIAQLGMERITREMGLKMEHVPYKGGGPMLADLMAGQIPIGLSSLPSLSGPHQSGRIRVIGVMSAQRSELYRDAQAVSELIPKFESVSNIYVVAPSGVPSEVVDKLNAAFNEVMRTQEAIAYFAKQGALVRKGAPDALKAMIAQEVEQWGQLVRSSGSK